MDGTHAALVAGTLGFLLGLQHATDPDHLVAVATIVTRERRFRDGAVIGALWGLGHSLTLAAAGAIVLALGLAAHLPEAPFEIAVAVMLIGLGALRLREAARGLRSVPRAHLVVVSHADHHHGALEIVHSHSHPHGPAEHHHAHVHPSRRLVEALIGRRDRVPLRPLLVGAVHGLAGTAALALAVLATVRSPLAAALYITLFGFGTIAGMTALTAVLAYPLSLATRFERARHAVGLAAGVGAIAFGAVYGYGAL